MNCFDYNNLLFYNILFNEDNINNYWEGMTWKNDKKIISDSEITKYVKNTIYNKISYKNFLISLKYSKDIEERRICKCFFKLSNFFKSVN